MSIRFAGFEERTIGLDGVDIFARIGGSGAPLVLLHGYPQTGAMWHPVAAALAERFRVIVPDLRGYGRSSCPANDPENRAYSKRAMGGDIFGLMRELGHERFLLAGHDRGGRVAYRMALDRPERVAALSVLDIVPTAAFWNGLTLETARRYYHWLMLAQPFPLPETLIGANPRWFMEYSLASWTGTQSLAVFDADALAEYRECFCREATIHATCNDYRAGATYDLDADEADREAGRKIVCPVQVLWGAAGTVGRHGRPMETWSEWCEGGLEGKAIDAGHFVVEENPAATLEALLRFFQTHAYKSVI